MKTVRITTSRGEYNINASAVFTNNRSVTFEVKEPISTEDVMYTPIKTDPELDTTDNAVGTGAKMVSPIVSIAIDVDATKFECKL